MRNCEIIGAVALVASGLAVAGCSRAAGSSERVEQFEVMLSEELGTEVELRCPPMIDNTYHYCTAVVPSQEGLVFPVRVVSQGSELDYTTKDWVSGTRMVKLGRHALEEKYDVDVDSLTCPMISHMPEGATVRCDAEAEGTAVTLEVAVVPKVRKLEFVPVAGVVLGEEAARVAHVELLREGVHAEVSCPQRVVVSVPGKRFECKAVLEDDTVSTVHYLVTDTKGGFELGTEPPKAGAGETPT